MAENNSGLYGYSVLGAKVFTHNGSTFYGYSVLEVQTALTETLAECTDVSENPTFSAGVEWAYRRMCKKLGLDDEKEVEE